ncbi:MAG: ASKHA domain-containing protein [Planctomycetes bacterium]|nr:ASKHA domain-containing protein [Planctomycetota bacterium]
MPVVSFQPSGRKVDVPPGTKLLDACRQAGFHISAACGEKGLCGKCRVKVLAGQLPADHRQEECLPPTLLAEGWRASCVVDSYPDLVVEDPVDGEAGGIILTDFLGREPECDLGLWEKEVVLPKPSTSDQRDDVERLTAALRDAAGAEYSLAPELPLPLLRVAPELIRAADFNCRVVGVGDTLLDIEPAAAPPGRRLGLAIDIGTTTLAVALCDLADGSVLSVASRANPQARRGDDVISRVDYADSKDRLDEMRLLVVNAIEELSGETLLGAGLEGAQPLLAAVGSNTVMNHLLLGVTPRALALSPFIPAFRSSLQVSAAELGWRGDRPPLMYIIPNVSAYVGGDITAGMLAHDVAQLGGVTLFLDVGTNGEIALAVDGLVYACATAAGPAFEGARISQGMRAAPGAISRVGLSPLGMLDIGVVDGIRPARGICGTGLLDAVATLLAAGVVDESGRILDLDEAEELRPPPAPGLLAMMDEDDDGSVVWLEKPENGGQGVKLTQRDIREFQLAKGAVAAGVVVLLGVAGLKPEQVDRVMLAGGFGNYLDPASALAVGLLPSGIMHERVHSVGNASLAGARLCLLSEHDRHAADALVQEVRYIELSGRADFQEAFADGMMFPSL